MVDPAIQRMFTEIIAGQAQAATQAAQVEARLAALENNGERVIRALLAMSQTHVLLRESLEKLAEAATAEQKGSEVADALRAIQSLLTEQGSMIERATSGIEGLHDIMQGAARRAAGRKPPA